MEDYLQTLYHDCFNDCALAVNLEDNGDYESAIQNWTGIINKIATDDCLKAASTSNALSIEPFVEAIKEIEFQCYKRLDWATAIQLSRSESVNDPSKFGSQSDMTGSDNSKPINEYDSSLWLQSGLAPSNMTPPEPSPDVQGGTLRDSGKYTMRTTLRDSSSFNNSRVPKSGFFSKLTERPGATKAASLAWSIMTGGAKIKPNSETSSASLSRPSSSLQRPSFDAQSNPSATQQDPGSKGFVYSRRSSEKSRRISPQNLGGNPTSASSPSLLSISAATSAINSSSISDSRVSESPRSRPRPSPGIPASSSRFVRPLSASRSADTDRNPEIRSRDVRRKPVTSSRSFSARPTGPATSIREPSPPSSRRSSSDYSQGSVYITHSNWSAQSTGDPMSQGHPAQVLSSNPGQQKYLKWDARKRDVLDNLPSGIDLNAATQILDEIIVHGDEVHWQDVAGLSGAKSALREAIVYPLLRPDLFGGLREPAGGILLFGPPGTGKTMIAKACATESGATFFYISASSLTSKYLGESEKLVRALFALSKLLSPSIIFVDEIDSIMGQRSSSGEHEASRRIKTEFLIQWSTLQHAAAGKDSDNGTVKAKRVLVLAATNLPWAIDEAARRRFSRRQYIALPDDATRRSHLQNLTSTHTQSLSPCDIDELVRLTEGFSGSDITTLAKDAAMGPLRSLGESVLTISKDDISPITMKDFLDSLGRIRASVSKSSIEQHESWAKEYGETV